MTLVQNLETDLPTAFFGLSQAAATVSELAMFLAIPMYRKDLREIFDEFRATFAQCKLPIKKTEVNHPQDFNTITIFR